MSLVDTLCGLCNIFKRVWITLLLTYMQIHIYFKSIFKIGQSQSIVHMYYTIWIFELFSIIIQFSVCYLNYHVAAHINRFTSSTWDHTVKLILVRSVLKIWGKREVQSRTKVWWLNKQSSSLVHCVLEICIYDYECVRSI